MLKSALLCLVASLKQFALKNSQLVKKAKTRKVYWLTMLKKAEYLLKVFVSKLKNAEGTVITVMVETLFKYLINSTICVGVLQLLDLLAMFDLHRIKFI